MQNKIEANGSRLRILEEVLRESDGGESPITEGSSRTPSTQALAAVLHANDAANNADHVPVVRARRRPAVRRLVSHCLRAGAGSRPIQTPAVQPVGGAPPVRPRRRTTPQNELNFPRGDSVILPVSYFYKKEKQGVTKKDKKKKEM